MNDLTLIGDGHIENIQSVGLVFGPNFFTAYFYSDVDAREIIAYTTVKESKKANLGAIRKKNYIPLFAFSFNKEWTLMPNDVFEEKDAKAILNFNTKPDKSDAVIDRLFGLEAVLISESDTKSDKLVEQFFPGLELKHGVGPLLDYCKKDSNGSGYQMYLHQASARYTLVVFKNKELILANSFDGKYDEDVRYFVLFAMKQLNIENDVKCTMLGEAAVNNKIQSLLSDYLSDVRTPKKTMTEQNISSLNSHQLGLHWLGLNAAACAL
jgi:hypothetical protein